MNLWIGVLAAAAGCYLFKLLGLSIPHGVLERPTVRRIAALLPVALLAALVGVQTFADGETVVVDARLAGLAVAVAALLLRAPFLVVVFAAAATTALLRLAF
ncbi:MAG TPA: AzlD domain-containing protein [Kribbellaceae bacterium]|nr:AzlD domain-containing protein [Kribbellaceae bacterium]